MINVLRIKLSHVDLEKMNSDTETTDFLMDLWSKELAIIEDYFFCNLEHKKYLN